MIFRCQKGETVIYAAIDAAPTLADYPSLATDLAARKSGIAENGEAADFDSIELVPDLVHNEAQIVTPEK